MNSCLQITEFSVGEAKVLPNLVIYKGQVVEISDTSTGENVL